MEVVGYEGGFWSVCWCRGLVRFAAVLFPFGSAMPALARFNGKKNGINRLIDYFHENNPLIVFKILNNRLIDYSK